MQRWCLLNTVIDWLPLLLCGDINTSTIIFCAMDYWRGNIYYLSREPRCTWLRSRANLLSQELDDQCHCWTGIKADGQISASPAHHLFWAVRRQPLAWRERTRMFAGATVSTPYKAETSIHHSPISSSCCCSYNWTKGMLHSGQGSTHEGRQLVLHEWAIYRHWVSSYDLSVGRSQSTSTCSPELTGQQIWTQCLEEND